MDWFLYDNGLRHERVKQHRCFHVNFAITLFVVENLQIDTFATPLFEHCNNKVKSRLSVLRQFLTTENHLKMMKNAF